MKKYVGRIHGIIRGCILIKEEKEYRTVSLYIYSGCKHYAGAACDISSRWYESLSLPKELTLTLGDDIDLSFVTEVTAHPSERCFDESRN